MAFYIQQLKKIKQKNIEEEKENTDNVIVVGAPGSGKTQDVIKHALLQNTGSIIVNDEDFTLYKQTKDILQKRGYQIKKLDLCKPQDSCTYNPLMYTKTERDVLTVANFILNTTTDKNATGTVELEKAKQLLLLTCIYYVLENETDKTLLPGKGNSGLFS
ncbi:type IV secretory system conjugative DNA transfer family protein [Anaerobutyricum hallii]|nr:type IV secretory system conjugative DNA transfer family protein [Anaerobutyricum hallii]